MLDITGGERCETLNLGDDAEEAVFDVIQKTGRHLLEEWSANKALKLENQMEEIEKSYRPHKKNSKLKYFTWRSENSYLHIFV